MKGQVSVTMGRESGKYFIRVAVHSLKKRGLVASSKIDPGVCSGNNHLLQLIAASAGASAEQLCRKYKDPLNPSLCAKQALEDFNRECQLMDNLKLGFQAKLAKVLAQPLQDQVREKLDKVRFLVERGAPVTSMDDAYVTSLLIQNDRKGVK